MVGFYSTIAPHLDCVSAAFRHPSGHIRDTVGAVCEGGNALMGMAKSPKKVGTRARSVGPEARQIETQGLEIPRISR